MASTEDRPAAPGPAPAGPLSDDEIAEIREWLNACRTWGDGEENLWRVLNALDAARATIAGLTAEQSTVRDELTAERARNAPLRERIKEIQDQTDRVVAPVQKALDRERELRKYVQEMQHYWADQYREARSEAERLRARNAQLEPIHAALSAMFFERGDANEAQDRLADAFLNTCSQQLTWNGPDGSVTTDLTPTPAAPVAQGGTDRGRCPPCLSKMLHGLGGYPWTCSNGHTLYRGSGFGAFGEPIPAFCYEPSPTPSDGPDA